MGVEAEGEALVAVPTRSQPLKAKTGSEESAAVAELVVRLAPVAVPALLAVAHSGSSSLALHRRFPVTRSCAALVATPVEAEPEARAPLAARAERVAWWARCSAPAAAAAAAMVAPVVPDPAAAGAQVA